MRRQNRKEAVAALHRARIMSAAQDLFSKKGFAQTTIDDISRAAEYSRRTIYAYYESKEDILHHIVEKGLLILKKDIEQSIGRSNDFLAQYRGICCALYDYQHKYFLSASSVKTAGSAGLDLEALSHTTKRILSLGTEINNLLAAFVESGKKKGTVRQEIASMMTVFILWSSIESLVSLAQAKGPWIARQLSISEQDFLEYGFRQIINSILVERI